MKKEINEKCIKCIHKNCKQSKSVTPLKCDYIKKEEKSK
jgi:hypothetical protein